MSTAVVKSTMASIPSEVAGEAIIQQVDHLAASQWYTAEQVAQRVQLVQQVYRAVMKQDTHYGIIPGCDKPSLWKAGSEQLMMTFRIAANPEVEDLSTSDCARYRVTLHLKHAPTGMHLGSGIGECSSGEAKYKWRKAVCEMEYDATNADHRRLVWKDGSRGPYSIMQVRTEPADLANTVLKMAKKRAQIDAVLTVTAASDIFTQDIEDMDFPPETENAGAEQGAEGESPKPQQPPVQMPQRRQAQASPDQPAATTQPQQQPPLQPRTYSEPARQAAPPQSSNFRQQQAQQHREAPSQSARVPQGEKISEPQDKRFFAICMGNGITKSEMTQYLQQRWGVSNSRDIVKGDMYEECCKWAEGK